MRKLIPYFLELTIYCVLLLGLWHGRELWQWAAGYPPVEDRLFTAVALGDTPMFEQALSDGASVDTRDATGATALMSAAGTNRLDFARKLIDCGADLNATDNHGGTALFYAAEAGSIQMIQLLLAHGADALHRGPQGQTARDVALLLLHPDAASLLPEPNAKSQ